METGTNCAWEIAMAWKELDNEDEGDYKYTTPKQQAKRVFVPGNYAIE
jgi:hypothetical protein